MTQTVDEPGLDARTDHTACAAFHAHPDVIERLRAARIADADAMMLAETFRVLGDTTRVRILDALSFGELCVCDLAALLDLSESAVSHQLRLLRGMRLVRPRRAGRMAFYALDDRHIIGLVREGLDHVVEAPSHGTRGRVRGRAREAGGSIASRPARFPDDDADDNPAGPGRGE